jgi:glycogen operon protein
LTLACRLDGGRGETSADRDDNDFFLIFNAAAEPSAFTLCAPPRGRRWLRAIDTALPSPADISAAGEEPAVEPARRYRAEGRSLVVLLAG